MEYFRQKQHNSLESSIETETIILLRKINEIWTKSEFCSNILHFVLNKLASVQKHSVFMFCSFQKYLAPWPLHRHLIMIDSKIRCWLYCPGIHNHIVSRGINQQNFRREMYLLKYRQSTGHPCSGLYKAFLDVFLMYKSVHCLQCNYWYCSKSGDSWKCQTWWYYPIEYCLTRTTGEEGCVDP